MIRANHPDISGNIKTFLTSKANSGQAVLSVLDNSGFVQNDFIIIGDIGSEQTEIKKILSTTNKDTITVSSNLDFSHEKNCKIYFIKYDQVKFYKASTIDGTYDVVSTKDLAIAEPYTLYDESGSLTSDFFKIKYYNSFNSELSVFSDAISSSGFPSYSLAMLVDAFLEEAQDKTEKFYKRSEISRWINDCKNDCFNKLADNNENFYSGYHEFQFINGVNEITLNTDFKKLKMLQVSFDGVNYHYAHHEDLANTSPERIYSTNEPKYYLKGTTKLGIRPTPTADVAVGAKLWSEDNPADLEHDSDELPSPMNRYVDMVMNYMWYRALRKDKKFTESRIYKSEYEGRRYEFIEETNNLVLNENRSITEDEFDEYELT